MKLLSISITIFLFCLFNFVIFSQNVDSVQINYKIFNDISVSYSSQNNKLQIKCSNDFIPYKLYVYNVAGTLIYSFKSIEEQFPFMEYYIELPKGIYVINVENRIKTISKKIIVNR